MAPALREEFIEIMQVLQAEQLMMFAQVYRVAQATSEDYASMMAVWQGIADGKVIGEDMDEKGRPIIDSAEDFVAFMHFDEGVMSKYGQSLQA